MLGKTSLFKQYHRLHHMFFQCVSKQLSNPMAHPGQGALLGCILEKGSMSQRELCRKLGVSAAAVAVSLRRLEQQKLLSRQQNPNDLRKKLLALTPLGEKAAREIHDALETVQTVAIRGFSPEEVHKIQNYLSRIAANLNDFLESDLPENSRAKQGE